MFLDNCILKDLFRPCILQNTVNPLSRELWTNLYAKHSAYSKFICGQLLFP
jgi:hypothetical protein